MLDKAIVFATAVGAAAFAVGCSHRSAYATPGSAHADGGAATVATTAPTVTAMPASDDPLAMPAASVAAVVNPDGLPPYGGPTGIVEGTVLVKGPEAPDVPDVSAPLCPAAIDTYGKLFRAGPARVDGLRPLADALVVATGYTGFFVPEKENAARATIGTNCAYPTRTIAMTFGQWLEISNASKQPFGPFLEGVLLGAVRVAPTQQSGEAIKVYPPRAGHFIMHDRLQPFVREDVWVLRHPLHAVTDLTGHFRIEGVPVGALKVGAELAAIESRASADIEVRQHVVQNVELVLTYAPKPPMKAVDTRRPDRRLPPND